MRSNFDKAITILFDLEGYESDDPNDKGGFTRYGISQINNPDVNVPQLTKELAIKLYLVRYWMPLGCDDLEYPQDVVLFIQGVNVGTKAKTWMNESKGLCDFFMKCLKHYATRTVEQRKLYLAGWSNRLVKLWEAI
jgi:lysozyme family protein